jgi:XRE family aerobic/anaerobic benzoate catabolism transcriptional regulator
LQTRMPLYEQALAQVNTSNRPEQSSINDVLAVIAKHRFIDKLGP